MSTIKKVPVKILTMVFLLIVIVSAMAISPSAEEYEYYTSPSFTEEWALYNYGALQPNVVFKVMLSTTSASDYDYIFLCVNESETDQGMLYIVEDYCSTGNTTTPFSYKWSFYHVNSTTGGIYKPVKTQCAVTLYGLNCSKQTCELLYDGINVGGGTYGYTHTYGATGVLQPYKVGALGYVFDGTEDGIQTLSTICASLTNENAYSLSEINYLITHKDDPSATVLGYQWYCPADIDALINSKETNESPILGQYHWYSKAEWDRIGDLVAKYKEQLTQSQLEGMNAYERGLADGRSDVSSLGDGISSLGTNIGTSIKTVLTGVSIGGINLGDLLLFLVFGVIVLVIIFVVIRFLKG